MKGTSARGGSDVRRPLDDPSRDQLTPTRGGGCLSQYDWKLRDSDLLSAASRCGSLGWASQALLGGALLALHRCPHLPGAPARRAHAQEGGPRAERSRPPLESAGNRAKRARPLWAPRAASHSPSLPGHRAEPARLAPQRSRVGTHDAEVQAPRRSPAAPGALRAGPGPAAKGGPGSPFPRARSPPPAPPRQLRRQLPLFAPPAWLRPGAAPGASPAHLPSAAGEPCRWAAWR